MAAGLSPREPLAQAALTFATDVLAQAEDGQEEADASAFYDGLFDYVEQFPDVGLGLTGHNIWGAAKR
jgi:hypothetical protein